jgi:hypothetical protein
LKEAPGADIAKPTKMECYASKTVFLYALLTSIEKFIENEC